MKVRSIFRALCICLFVFPVVLVAQGYDIQWADTIDNGDRDYPLAVVVDNSNNIVVTGYSYIGGGYDYFTVKYAPTGGISEDEGSDLLSNNPIFYDIYPNPAGDEKCVIRYCLPYASDVEIKIYNIAGALVRVLENTSKEAGHYTIYWDNRDRSGRKVSNGVYFSRFFANPIARTGDYQATKKLLITR